MLTHPLSPRWFINAVFIASRIVFYCSGIRFDASRLDSLHQFIDPNLLQNRLGESLFYLHNQPPLFNLFLGVVLKLFPHHASEAFTISFLLNGLVLTNVMYELMVKLGASPLLSARLTVVCIVSPSCILYENWLFYTYPIAVLLCVSAFFLYQYLSRKTPVYGFLFFSCLSMLVLLRSVFHIVWFLLLFLLLFVWQKSNRREIVKMALLPLALVLVFSAKNYWLYGTFTASSSFGMHIAKIALAGLGADELNPLIDDGAITPLARIDPFKDLTFYSPYWTPQEKTGIPLLDNEIKSAGFPNLNQLSYIFLSHQYAKDSLHAIERHPLNYLKNVIHNFYYYFIPSSYYPFVHVNRMSIYYYERAYNALIYGRWLDTIDRPQNSGEDKWFDPLELLLNTGTIVALSYGSIVLFYSWYAWISYKTHSGAAVYATIVFLLINIVFITFVSNITEYGENQRYRYETEPSAFVLVGVMIGNMMSQYKKSKEKNTHEPSNRRNIIQTHSSSGGFRMKHVQFSFGWLSAAALVLSLVPMMGSAQGVELPITWNGEGHALLFMEQGLEELSIQCTLKVDTDGWATGKIVADKGEAVLKRFYYEEEVEGARTLVLIYLDNNEESPGLYILKARIIASKLLYGEVFRKAYEKEGAIEKDLSLGDNAAQQIFPDYFPASLKKAMEKCKPVGCFAAQGSIVK